MEALRCARTKCTRVAVRLPGKPDLCPKHHASLGTGRSKLERRVRVEGEARAFGSGWEAERGAELRLLESSGAITDLAFQVSFALRIEAGQCVVDPSMKSARFYPKAVRCSKNGILIERYVADAVYHEVGFAGFRFETGECAWTVEDSKHGYLSGDFKRKEKWMREGYGITIRVAHKNGRT